MAKNEEMLEELYELLTLYFQYSYGDGLVKAGANSEYSDPTLDRVIFREKILAQITSLIIEGR